MSEPALLHESLTRSIIGGFFKVHRVMGCGFVESVYSAALADELRRRGHAVDRERLVRVYYLGREIARQRIDMLVDETIVVENKAGEKLPPLAEHQLYNYLRCTDHDVGLLFHFGPEPKFKRVIHSRNLKHARDHRASPQNPR